MEGGRMEVEGWGEDEEVAELITERYFYLKNF